MANRRFGGGPGAQRGGFNRGFNSSQSSSISPWQGGGGPSGNVAPNTNNSNIQNQLALALTSLIQQTSKQPSAGGPPSLLNMNNSSGFYNQDNFNSQNRFGNRGNQDFRPFNKNNGGGGGRQWGPGNANRIVKRGSGNMGQKTPFNNFRNKNPKSSPTKLKRTTPVKPKTPVKAEEGATEEAVEGDAKRSALPSQFDGLPKGLLHCFVCNKTMWDGESFQNHIGGKAHKQMISSLEESFQITVNILRENMRLSEERKMIEIQRSQRRYRNKNMIENENLCNMCDLKFMGKIAVHRQTEGHQRLKRFLHPKCHRCILEFPYRMEWVDHHFTKEHLFKLKEFLDTKDLAPEDYKVKIQAEIDLEPLLEETVHNEDDNPVVELSEDLNNLFNRIPVHKRTRVVSKQSLSAASGFICNLCKLYMTTEEESEAHLKTAGHHKCFVKAIKAKHQKALNDKKKAEEAAAAGNDEAKEEDEIKEEGEEEKAVEDMYDPFEADGNEDEEEKKEEEDDEKMEEEPEKKEVEAEVKEEPKAKEVKEEPKEVPATPAKEAPATPTKEVPATPAKEVPATPAPAVAAAPATAPGTPNTRQKRVVKGTPAPKAKKAKN